MGVGWPWGMGMTLGEGLSLAAAVPQEGDSCAFSAADIGGRGGWEGG